MMVARALLLSMLIILACFPLWSNAAWQIVVHRNSTLQILTVTEVKFLFTEGQVQGQAPDLVDLIEEPMRAHFYESVLHMTLSRWRANWAKRVFTGNHRLPKQMPLEEVLSYIEGNPGSVAYLPSTLVLPPTLKVIYCGSGELPAGMPLPCAPTAAGRSQQKSP
jgi:hypothetical protein